VIEALASAGAQPAHIEGYERSEWVLLDYFDFIVHVFAPETRLFYGLERLWGSAEHVDISALARPPQRLPPQRLRG
jgi:ribosome-associated protein